MRNLHKCVLAVSILYASGGAIATMGDSDFPKHIDLVNTTFKAGEIVKIPYDKIPISPHPEDGLYIPYNVICQFEKPKKTIQLSFEYPTKGYGWPMGPPELNGKTAKICGEINEDDPNIYHAVVVRVEENASGAFMMSDTKERSHEHVTCVAELDLESE